MAAPNGWGCGYVSGFRVPLLVVSPYTQAATISGKCGVTGYPACGFTTSEVFPYVHDFGSILAFTEYNFNMPWITKPDPYYADYNAPDWGQLRNNIPLSDFFPLTTARPFVPITTLQPYTCFQHYAQCTGVSYTPTGPDDDNAADQ